MTRREIFALVLGEALVVALLGALGSLMNAARIGDVLAGTAERPVAVVVSTVMFVVLVAYLVAGVRSFVAARRARAVRAWRGAPRWPPRAGGGGR